MRRGGWVRRREERGIDKRLDELEKKKIASTCKHMHEMERAFTKASESRPTQRNKSAKRAGGGSGSGTTAFLLSGFWFRLRLNSPRVSM
jgi:hypothetical protein